jgi:hypothetical protein
MDTTIRDVDEAMLQALRARAALENRPVGEVISDAIRSYLARNPARKHKGSLRSLQPEPYPVGNEHLSMEIDAVLYGSRR